MRKQRYGTACIEWFRVSSSKTTQKKTFQTLIIHVFLCAHPNVGCMWNMSINVTLGTVKSQTMPPSTTLLRDFFPWSPTPRRKWACSGRTTNSLRTGTAGLCTRTLPPGQWAPIPSPGMPPPWGGDSPGDGLPRAEHCAWHTVDFP